MSISLCIRRVLLLLSFTSFIFLTHSITTGQRRRPPAGGKLGIVVDERLSAVREAPQLTARLIRRLSRGRLVAVRGERRGRDRMAFCRVNLSSRTAGWLQCDALIVPSRKGEDERLFELIKSTRDFDRIVRERIFLDAFPHSSFRAAVLLLHGLDASEVAEKLSRDAAKRLEGIDSSNRVGPPLFSYYLNYSGLDRYNRQGVIFLFDAERRRFLYNGAAWRELVRRYPRSLEAREAASHLLANHLK